MDFNPIDTNREKIKVIDNLVSAANGLTQWNLMYQTLILDVLRIGRRELTYSRRRSCENLH